MTRTTAGTARPIHPNRARPHAHPAVTERGATSTRPGIQMPTVTELPRRWDPLADAETVVRGTD
jgi:hypothetical protein